MRPLPLEYACIEDVFSSLQAVSVDAQAALDGDLRAMPSNVFYSVAEVEPGTERTFIKQHIFALDIDGVPQDQALQVLEAAASTLGVQSLEHVIGVFSGHGVHLLLPLKTPAETQAWFTEYREHFKFLCHQVNMALEAKRLNGIADPTSFGRGKVFRLPGTLNAKPGKAVVECVILRPLTPSWGAFKFDFDDFAEGAKFSGANTKDKRDYISDVVLKQFPKPDVKAILGDKGCLFLRTCRDEPQSVTEPQWYAMLSLTSRLDETGKLSHDMSRGHKGYSEAETASKNKQALLASGPRTCASIGEVFPGCHKCPHFEKIKSPILIRSKGFVATEHTGFHFITPGVNGAPDRATPDIHGFVDYVAREFGPILKPRGLSNYLFWEGTHFSPRDEGWITRLAHDKFNPQVRPHTVVDCLKLFEQKFPGSTDLSLQEKKINLNNGVLDLAHSPPRLLEHAPEYQFTYVSDFDYDPKAEAPQFEAFLEDVCSGNQENIRVIKEFFGYAMFSTTNFLHKALFLVGDGANGKSVLLEIMRYVFGENNTTSVSIDDLAKDTHKTRLFGKSLNLSGETGMKSLLKSEEFKKIVSGDMITARDLYEQAVEFVPRVKMVVACNELPQITDRSSGTTRRMLVVKFRKNYEEMGTVDPFLVEKLKPEAPGILNILIKSYSELMERRILITPQESKELLYEHRLENDSVLSFCKFNILDEPGEDAFVSCSHLYDSYKAYCEDSGLKPLNKVRFFRFFSEQTKLQSFLKKIAGKPIRGYNTAYSDEYAAKSNAAFGEY